MPFSWTFPYPSQRMPVVARNVVATSQPLAAQAGLEMMRRGGNAIDAAVAAAACLTVVEPTSNGIGSDAFALVWSGGGLHGLNASGRSPAAMTPDRYAGTSEISRRGWAGVTVPGAVSAWVELAERFGALPLSDVLAPAIHYARDGFHVSPITGSSWRRARRAYADFPDWQRTFAPNGEAPANGERFRSKGHATTLEAIAETNGEAFYRGHLAQAMDAAARAQGGLMTADDLARHRAEWVRPISIEYHGVELHEIPPNGQGLAALIMLGILRHLDVAAHPVDSAASLHLQIEAMKLAFADGHRHIADPAYMEVTTRQLLDPAYLESRARLIDPTRAQNFNHGEPLEGGTVYLTAADEHGNMISFIQSNYTGFGSGIVVPDTGISLQNRGCCFTLEEGHPNQLGPNKLPYHTIIPGFLTRNGEPLMSFGVMGGFMQPQGHAQVVIRMTDYDQNPQAALDAPRWQVMRDTTVNIESGYDDAVYQTLRDMGHDVRIAQVHSALHGRGQCAYRLADGYVAASDHRADGQAVGF